MISRNCAAQPRDRFIVLDSKAPFKHATRFASLAFVQLIFVTLQVLPGRNNLGHAIAGFLFAVHPIHSEAVAGIVGRADLLACLLTLSAFLAYCAHCDQTRAPFPLLLALVSSTLATLAKETGISSLALCLLWELCRGESNRKVSICTDLHVCKINLHLQSREFSSEPPDSPRYGRFLQGP